MATNADNPPMTMTTEPLTQCQQTGESQTSHITDAAQLTHPITRADDVDMIPAPATPRPDTHGTAATTRRHIGGRCRKWVVNTKTPSPSLSNERKCAACTMCGNQLAPGEPRLHQWAYRDAQRHYVNAQCITSGIGRDHELVPMAPTDAEAMNTVINTRDSVRSS